MLAGAQAGEQGRAQLEPSRTSHCTHGGERGPCQIPEVPLGPGTGATWSQVPLSLCPRDPPGLKLRPSAGVTGLPVPVSCGAAHVWGGVCWVERGVCRAMAPPWFLEASGQPVQRVLPSVRLCSQACGACDADFTEMRAVLRVRPGAHHGSFQTCKRSAAPPQSWGASGRAPQHPLPILSAANPCPSPLPRREPAAVAAGRARNSRFHLVRSPRPLGGGNGPAGGPSQGRDGAPTTPSSPPPNLCFQCQENTLKLCNGRQGNHLHPGLGRGPGPP